MAVSRGNSGYPASPYSHEKLMVLSRIFHNSIIEGTRESLARLGLSYVDVIFAHRHDHNGVYGFVADRGVRYLTRIRVAVPMEEIVRAFNYVIDQGWVSFCGIALSLAAVVDVVRIGSLLGYL